MRRRGSGHAVHGSSAAYGIANSRSSIEHLCSLFSFGVLHFTSKAYLNC